MSIRIYVPADTTAIALGADDTAAAIGREAAIRGIDVELVRTGSRGAFWLEPLVEIADGNNRLGFAALRDSEVAELFEAGFPGRCSHRTAIGRIAEHPWFSGQHRLTFARAGLIDPASLEDYLANGGYRGLERAIALGGEATVAEILSSGLRGRGGAAFPAGIKWRTVRDTQSSTKFVVCNADEGDSGTFADRLLMESDPFQLIEGMTIAGIATGATRGYIYVRSEYPLAFKRLRRAVDTARDAGRLGADVCGSGQSFDLEVRLAAGSYVCGEETALLDSLEGKRGMVRAKPPLPAHRGLFGQPTLIHNVLSLAAATSILADGASAYQALGTGRSLGTTAIQLAGNISRGGLVELAFGATIRDLVEGFGNGSATGRPLSAVQIGGPLGAYIPPEQWDTALDYEALAAIGGMLGHGGIVAFDDSVDMLAMARFAMEFCAVESCGKCTPCRIGAVRGVEVIDRITAGDNVATHIRLLDELCETMTHGSLCAMGGLTPLPVRSAMALSGHPIDERG